MTGRRLVVVLVCVVFSGMAGCKGCPYKSGPPKLTADLMPAMVRGLVLGASSEADVKSRFPWLTRYADKRLGGTNNKVEYLHQPAVVLLERHKNPKAPFKSGIHKAEFWFGKGAGGKLVLMGFRIAVKRDERRSVCHWIRKTVGRAAGKVPAGAPKRPNRDGWGVVYRARTLSGKLPVMVMCKWSRRYGRPTEEISYLIVDKNFNFHTAWSP